MSTEGDFVFTVNVTMAVSETGSVEDAAATIEDAIWSELPGADYDVSSLVVVGKLS